MTMKKLALALLAAVLALPAAAGVIISTTSSHSGAADARRLYVKAGDAIDYSVSGTFVGQTLLQRSFDGTNYQPVKDASGLAISTGGFNGAGNSGGTYSGRLVHTDGASRAASYRFFSSTYTSGSFVTILQDVDDTVQEFKNSKGIPVLTINDDTITTPNALTVSSNLVVGGTITGTLSGGAAPTGAAGGNLSGTYPNPTVGSLGAVSVSGTLTTTANPGYSISNTPVFGEIATVATAARARVIIKASASDTSRLGQVIMAPGNTNTLFCSTASVSLIVNQTNLIGNVAGDTMLNMSPGSFGNTWTLNAYDSDGSLSVSDGVNDIISIAQGSGSQTLSLASSGANVRSGDAAVTTQGNGLVLRATTGATCWRVTVTSLGVLATASVTCP